LCFIGKVRLPEFYSKNCNKEGLIIQIDKMIRFTILKSPQIYQLKRAKSGCCSTTLYSQMGKVVGKHQESALFYNWTTQRLKCGWNN
jgi:hypothetical protein